ncbi:hypothetical protein SAMN05878276_0386 [Aquipseudomonas alcaligenes]|uniref:hypothetical protein n=1 Tax=Aquipseudomonas alcaligenes TaxID=43263 RepID=UPI0009550636|nr:hypothetical protein [Pseudomonas alcaligenes]SIR82187.1 hypothetical protein SAMN05878276_0386 [Pseudomonas alcaligenes]
MRRMFTVASLVLAGMLVALWLLSRLFAWGTCSWYGYQTDRATRYAAFVGCMVEVNGRWVPREELRIVQ